MPICFQLLDWQGEPVKLADLNACLWLHFTGSIPDDPVWFRNWYNRIGLHMAFGYSLNECKEYFKSDPQMVEVIDYIAQYYTPKSWYERR